MGKIVVFADGADAAEAKKALKAAGLDFEVVAPKPANLLHIVIGMVDDNDDEDEAEESPEEETPAEDEEAVDEPIEEPTEDAGEVTESLGTVDVDGELIEAVRSKSATSVLQLESIEVGAKTTYSLNESKFSFWPADVVKPTQRLNIKANKHHTSIELPLEESTQTRLVVGADLIDLFIK